jgi:hypothetical protein
VDGLQKLNMTELPNLGKPGIDSLEIEAGPSPMLYRYRLHEFDPGHFPSGPARFASKKSKSQPSSAWVTSCWNSRA